MSGPHQCLAYICTTGHMRFFKQQSVPHHGCLRAEMAKLTQTTHSNQFFVPKKSTDNIIVKVTEGKAELQSTFSMCLANIFKALSSLPFPLLSLQLQKLVVKSNPFIFISKTPKASLLYTSFWYYIGSISLTGCKGCEEKQQKKQTNQHIQKIPLSWGKLFELHVF